MHSAFMSTGKVTASSEQPAMGLLHLHACSVSLAAPQGSHGGRELVRQACAGVAGAWSRRSGDGRTSPSHGSAHCGANTGSLLRGCLPSCLQTFNQVPRQLLVGVSTRLTAMQAMPRDAWSTDHIDTCPTPITAGVSRQEAFGHRHMATAAAASG